MMLPDPVGIVSSRPFERLVALRYFLGGRSWTILLDVSGLLMSY
jgi:hypothetical protein